MQNISVTEFLHPTRLQKYIPLINWDPPTHLLATIVMKELAKCFDIIGHITHIVALQLAFI